MVADAEPCEIHLSLLSEDEKREYDEVTKNLINGLEELRLLDRAVTINTFVTFATVSLGSWLGVRMPIPLYNTLRVFGCFGWILAVVLFMVAVVYLVIEWWKTRDYRD